MSEQKQWRLGLSLRDKKNGGEFRVLSGVGEGWIGDIRTGSKLEGANCALILAAPVLLAACEAIVHAADTNDPAMGAIAATLARAAVAKAETA